MVVDAAAVVMARDDLGLLALAILNHHPGDIH
jgi:hypothetical protein